MNPKERILALRILEKVRANPKCAKTLGIEATENKK